MGWLSQLKEKAQEKVQEKIQEKMREATAAPSERLALSIPGINGQSLWKIAIEADLQPQPQGGEHLRLRAHIQANLASQLRPLLASSAKKLLSKIEQSPRLALPPAVEKSPALSSVALQVQQAQQRLQELSRQWAQQLSVQLDHPDQTVLNHDYNTWLEINATTASVLDRKSLMPSGLLDTLSRMGVDVKGIQPNQAHSWAGQQGNSFAHVSLLQLDDPRIVASLVNVIDKK